MDSMDRRKFFQMGGMAGMLAMVAPRLAKADAPIPAEMKMYEVAGQIIFPVYGNYGGISRRICAFPYLRQGKSMLVFGYWLDGMDMQRAWQEEYEVRIKHDSMAMFAAALRSGQKIVVRKDGEDMPKHGEIVRYLPNGRMFASYGG
jgi:hypothetical protein